MERIRKSLLDLWIMTVNSIVRMFLRETELTRLVPFQEVHSRVFRSQGTEES